MFCMMQIGFSEGCQKRRTVTRKGSDKARIDEGKYERASRPWIVWRFLEKRFEEVQTSKITGRMSGRFDVCLLM